jgi:hypothetical protein
MAAEPTDLLNYDSDLNIENELRILGRSKMGKGKEQNKLRTKQKK